MILFESTVKEIVERMEDVEINSFLTKSVQFEWGETPDLNRFIQTMGESSTPLVWSVDRIDQETEWGGWQRNAEFNFCTVETNVDKLNIDRIKEGYSFEKVLSPMWEDFKKKLRTSGNMSIVKGSVQIKRFPNYTIGNEQAQNAIWDVLKVRAKINYNEPYGACRC